MRLMYVALTRAKEQLYLIGTSKKADALEMMAAATITDEKLAAIDRFNAKTCFS